MKKTTVIHFLRFSIDLLFLVLSTIFLSSAIIVDNFYILSAFIDKNTTGDYPTHLRITPDSSKTNIASLDEHNGYDINVLYGGLKIRFLYNYNNHDNKNTFEFEAFDGGEVNFLSTTNYEKTNNISAYGFTLLNNQTSYPLTENQCYISKTIADKLIGQDNYLSYSDLIGQIMSYSIKNVGKRSVCINGIIATSNTFYGDFIFIPYKMFSNDFNRGSLDLIIKKTNIINYRYVLFDLHNKYPTKESSFAWKLFFGGNNKIDNNINIKINKIITHDYYPIKVTTIVSSILLLGFTIFDLFYKKAIIIVKKTIGNFQTRKSNTFFNVAYLLFVFLFCLLINNLNYILINNYMVYISNQISFFAISFFFFGLYFYLNYNHNNISINGCDNMIELSI